MRIGWTVSSGAGRLIIRDEVTASMKIDSPISVITYQLRHTKVRLWALILGHSMEMKGLARDTRHVGTIQLENFRNPPDLPKYPIQRKRILCTLGALGS